MRRVVDGGPALTSALGKAGHERVKAKFSFSAFQTELQSVVETVTEAEGGNSSALAGKAVCVAVGGLLTAIVVQLM